MKTTLTLITIITSLFFSACANNNRAEYSNVEKVRRPAVYGKDFFEIKLPHWVGDQ